MKKRINILIIITLLIFLIFVFIIYFKNPTIIFENKSKAQTEFVLKTFSNEGITIKEINLSTLRDSSLKSLIENKSANYGIYGFEITKENKQYLYFNGKSNTFADLEFKIEDSNLIISVKKTEDQSNNNNEKLLLLEKTDICNINSIQINVKDIKNDTLTIYEF